MAPGSPWDRDRAGVLGLQGGNEAAGVNPSAPVFQGLPPRVQRGTGLSKDCTPSLHDSRLLRPGGPCSRCHGEPLRPGLGAGGRERQAWRGQTRPQCLSSSSFSLFWPLLSSEKGHDGPYLSRVRPTERASRLGWGGHLDQRLSPRPKQPAGAPEGQALQGKEPGGRACEWVAVIRELREGLLTMWTGWHSQWLAPPQGCGAGTVASCPPSAPSTLHC